MSTSGSTRNTAAERPLSGFLPVAIAAIAGRMSVVLPGRVLLSVCAVCLFVSCDKAPEPRLPVSRLTLSQPCDVRQGCRAADESVAVTVTFDAEPRALQPFPIRIQLDGRQRADAVTVAFSMQGMDMGCEPLPPDRRCLGWLERRNNPADLHIRPHGLGGRFRACRYWPGACRFKCRLCLKNNRPPTATAPAARPGAAHR